MAGLLLIWCVSTWPTLFEVLGVLDPLAVLPVILLDKVDLTYHHFNPVFFDVSDVPYPDCGLFMWYPLSCCWWCSWNSLDKPVFSIHIIICMWLGRSILWAQELNRLTPGVLLERGYTRWTGQSLPVGRNGVVCGPIRVFFKWGGLKITWSLKIHCFSLVLPGNDDPKRHA